MNDDPKWKRKQPTRIYDYNFKVSEAYYNPQTEYISDRDLLRSKVIPPECQSYAERFAKKPWYGHAKGLPYNESESACGQPLVNRRAVSASRASSIMQDREDNVPSHIRVRRRTKAIEEEIGNDDKYREKPRRYHFEDEMDYKPSIFTKELRSDLNKLSDKINAPAPRRASVSLDMDDILGSQSLQPRRSSVSYELPVFDSELNLPGTQSISKSKSSYTLPSSGAKVSKSSYVETKSFESKPPTGARPRKTTESEVSFELPPRVPRSRKVSLDEFSYRPPRNLEALQSDDYDIKLSASELRDMRRAKESDELTEKIRGTISKMRSHDIDKEAAYKYTRQMRSSSLDPFGDDSKYSAKQRATKFRQFVYGVGK